MRVIEGLSGAWNYTIGPAFIFEGTESIDEINDLNMPVVVVAKTIPLEDLGRLELTRIYGFVLEEGGPGEPAMLFYSSQHRATVVRAKGALEAARPGELVIVDGVNGKVIFEPNEEVVAEYEKLRKQNLPPEPPGQAERLIEMLKEFQKIDPATLKGNLFDFEALRDSLDALVKMDAEEPLTAAEIAKIEAVVKETPVEEDVRKDIEQYQAAAKALAAQKAASVPPEERPAARPRGLEAKASDAAAEKGR